MSFRWFQDCLSIYIIGCRILESHSSLWDMHYSAFPCVSHYQKCGSFVWYCRYFYHLSCKMLCSSIYQQDHTVKRSILNQWHFCVLYSAHLYRWPTDLIYTSPKSFINVGRGLHVNIGHFYAVSTVTYTQKLCLLLPSSAREVYVCLTVNNINPLRVNISPSYVPNSCRCCE